MHNEKFCTNLEGWHYITAHDKTEVIFLKSLLKLQLFSIANFISWKMLKDDDASRTQKIKEYMFEL